jgi:signal transduction histidine kinase
MKNSIKIFGLLLTFSFPFGCFCANAVSAKEMSIKQSKVMAVVKKAEIDFKKYGKEKAIIEFKKHSEAIFMGDYKGVFFVSPLHPEMIGRNEFYYKDSSGILVVQEEIEKAKAGGGWLKGRWRVNPQTGKYQCRKIYILPIPGHYFIGSWYHYSSHKRGTCLI